MERTQGQTWFHEGKYSFNASRLKNNSAAKGLIINTNIIFVQITRESAVLDATLLAKFNDTVKDLHPAATRGDYKSSWSTGI